MLWVRPANGLQRSRVNGFGIVKGRIALLQLLQRHDFHYALTVAGRVWVCLRNQLAIVKRLQKRLFIPCLGWLFVALPKALRVFLEQLHQHLKLFSLCRVHPFVNRVHHFRGLLNHGQRGSNRRIGPTLAHLLFSRAADPHSRLGHVIDQLHQRR